jgi:hypothetical protein
VLRCCLIVTGLRKLNLSGLRVDKSFARQYSQIFSADSQHDELACILGTQLRRVLQLLRRTIVMKRGQIECIFAYGSASIVIVEWPTVVGNVKGSFVPFEANVLLLSPNDSRSVFFSVMLRLALMFG